MPGAFVQPLEIGFLRARVCGIAAGDAPPGGGGSRGATDAGVHSVGHGLSDLWVAAIWLMFQPMEMRATMMTG